MKIEIRKTKAYAQCCYNCDTYKDHKDWAKMKNMGRQIPIGEEALFISNGYEYNKCVCKVHAPAVIEDLKKQIIEADLKAMNLGWK